MLVEVAHLGKQLVEQDRLHARVEGGDEWLIFHVKTGEDVQDQLVVGEMLARSSELIARERICAKNAATDCVPFCAFARAMRMLLTLEIDCEQIILASADQSSCAWPMDVTCTSTSLDRLFSR